MKRICAWCGCALSDHGSFLISHGMCDDCAKVVLQEEIQKYVRRIEVPVLIVNLLGEVIGANLGAARFLKKDRSELENQNCGKALGCYRANQNVNCSDQSCRHFCELCKVIEDTFQDGEERQEVRIQFHYEKRRNTRKGIFHVSTRLIGGFVYLYLTAGYALTMRLEKE